MGYDIIAWGGQSNGQGSGLPFVRALDTTNLRVKQLAGSGPSMDKIILADEPLYHVSQGARVGGAMTFAKEYLKTLPDDRDVLIVPFAQPGTGFTAGDHGRGTWDWDDLSGPPNLGRRAVSKIQLALSMDPSNRLIGIVFAQGENDTLDHTGAQYRIVLERLFSQFRVNFPDVPIIVPGMVPEWVYQYSAPEQPERPPIDKVHREISSWLPRAKFVEPPKNAHMDDVIHYNSAGEREIGRRVFTALQNIDTETEPEGTSGPVFGNLFDFGFAPRPDLRPVIYFIPSNAAANGVDISYLFAPKPIPCVPNQFGAWSINLVDTGDLIPSASFTVRIDYLDAVGGLGAREYFPSELHVPFGGGNFTELINAKPNPLMAWAGNNEPPNKIFSTGWLAADGMYKEWEI